MGLAVKQYQTPFVTGFTFLAVKDFKGKLCEIGTVYGRHFQHIKNPFNLLRYEQCNRYGSFAIFW